MALKLNIRQAVLWSCLAAFCASSTALGDDGTNDAEAERARRIEYIQKAIKGDVSPVPGRKMVSAGTGFYVAPQMILTNRHVVEACAAVTIRGTDGRNVVSAVMAADKNQDLALIKAEPTPDKVAVFRGSTSYNEGAAIATIGYPDQGLPRIEPFLTSGTVLGPDRDDGRASRFIIKADVRHGNSGGPVFDAQGMVIGILNAKIDTVKVYRTTGRTVDNVGFAIANGPVFQFLAKQGIKMSINESRRIVPETDILSVVKGFTVRVGCWR